MPPLCRTKHNRAKPLSEAASALFSIADADEFRFARFYIVCEEVAIRDTHKSPKIVCRLADTIRRVLQTWKDMDHHGCQLRHG